MYKQALVLIFLVTLAPMVVAFNPQPEPPGRQRGKVVDRADRSANQLELSGREQKAAQKQRVVGSKLRESKPDRRQQQARRPQADVKAGKKSTKQEEKGIVIIGSKGGDKTAQKGIIVHRTAQPSRGMQMKKGRASLQEGPFN